MSRCDNCGRRILVMSVVCAKCSVAQYCSVKCMITDEGIHAKNCMQCKRASELVQRRAALTNEHLPILHDITHASNAETARSPPTMPINDKEVAEIEKDVRAICGDIQAFPASLASLVDGFIGAEEISHRPLPPTIVRRREDPAVVKERKRKERAKNVDAFTRLVVGDNPPEVNRMTMRRPERAPQVVHVEEAHDGPPVETCAMCKRFHDAVADGFNPELADELFQGCSRHRIENKRNFASRVRRGEIDASMLKKRPSTPPGFWDTAFFDSQ